MKSSIETVCNNSICVGCGSCVAVCPNNCVTMERNVAGFLRAYVREDTCLHCGKCVNVCPQLSVPHGIDNYKEKGYIVYAKDPKIRTKGQSGGAVTALLCYLFDYNKIDGAVVNQYNSKKNVNEAVYVTNTDAAINSSGSHYAQSDVCKVIYEHKECEVAAVLLGCQSRSIKLAEERGILKNVKYKIGLICDSQYSQLMIKDLIKQSTLPFSEVESFSWRGGEWPGKVCVKSKNKEVRLKAKHRTKLKTIYKNSVCSLCRDKMNGLADIVCGDPWGISIDNIKEGYSCIISRTLNGEELLANAEKEGYIVRKEIDPKLITQGQKVNEDYYLNKERIQELFVKKKWVYPKYLCEKTSDRNGNLDKAQIRQIEFEHEFYNSSTEKAVKKMIARKKRYLKILEFKKIPRKIIDKYNIKKNGDK